MKYTEEQLERFTKPISDTEKQRCENMINMIKDAIKSYYFLTNDPLLNPDNYEIFLQGSYANNTNVKQNSDVDICVVYKNVFRYEMPIGYKLGDGYSDSSVSYKDVRSSIKKALVNKFGVKRVEDKNKAIRILSNTYTVDADVVVAFQYRFYKDDTYYKEGISYDALDGTKIINYPKIHIDNGIRKNNDTNYMYKKMVRIFKKIMYDMQNERVAFNQNAKGFVIECMCYRYPNNKFLHYVDTKYTDNLTNMIDYFLNSSMSDWLEANEIKQLFGIGSGRNESDYKYFMMSMKRYVNG